MLKFNKLSDQSNTNNVNKNPSLRNKSLALLAAGLALTMAACSSDESKPEYERFNSTSYEDGKRLTAQGYNVDPGDPLSSENALDIRWVIEYCENNQFKRKDSLQAEDGYAFYGQPVQYVAEAQSPEIVNSKIAISACRNDTLEQGEKLPPVPSFTSQTFLEK